MPVLFKGARLKLEWAEQHINRLASETGRFFDAHYRLVVIAHFWGRKIIVEGQDAIPDEISLILGDAVHNLRASLDLLSYSLVEQSGRSFKEKAIRFPILDAGNDPERLKSAIQGACIHFAGTHVATHFEAFQAYAGGHLELWELDKLDIVDKHRLLLTTAHSVHIADIYLPDLDPLAPPGLISNTDFTNLRVIYSWPSRDPSWASFPLVPIEEHNLGTPFTIAFKEGPFRGQAVLPTLNRLANNVRSLIESIEALFG